MGPTCNVIQRQCFSTEINDLKSGHKLPRSSPLLPLHSFIDENELLRVGGRGQHSGRSYTNQHPVILPGNNHVTKLLIRSENLRLFHTGPTFLSCSLNRHLHNVGGRKVVRSITRAGVTCCRVAARPQHQLCGQLPLERVTPDIVLNKVGLDYAGPLLLKLGSTRRPTNIKAYVCVFVSLSVKTVHLELVSDLTTPAFVACLCRFVARQGKPVLTWSEELCGCTQRDQRIDRLP